MYFLMGAVRVCGVAVTTDGKRAVSASWSRALPGFRPGCRHLRGGRRLARAFLCCSEVLGRRPGEGGISGNWTPSLRQHTPQQNSITLFDAAAAGEFARPATPLSVPVPNRHGGRVWIGADS